MKYACLFLIVIIAFTFCQSQLVPPRASIIPDTLSIHDTTLVDNYRWLKDKTRSLKQVIDHIKAENGYTHQIMRSHQRMQEQLYDEMVRRISDIDVSVPVKIDDYFYYSVFESGKQYRRYCRKKGSLSAPEETYLDLNKLAEGHDFYSVFGFQLSSDHNLLALAIDTTGNEIYTLEILHIPSGNFLDDSVEGVSDMVWANDNKTLFYTIQDEAGRSYRVYRHIAGTVISQDELLYEEPDERFWVWVNKSRNKQFIEIGSDSKTTSELWLLEANRPDQDPQLFMPRKQNVKFYTKISKDQVFLITNQDAQNNQIFSSPLSKLSKPEWQLFLPHRDSVKIAAQIFADHIVITERCNNEKVFRIIDLNSNETHYLDFEEDIYSCYIWSGTEFDSSLLRYTYESLTTPYSVYDYDMNLRIKNIKKKQEIVGGYNPQEYESQKLYTSSRDGVQIPISLLYKKDKFSKDGSSPLFLTGYGAYGDSFDPYFSSARLSLLDRGVTYAIAHVRGGGELGKNWYEQGRMMNKKNTFFDFLACSEFLLENDFTSSDRFIIEGGSAGGLLVGAVINLKPELYLGAIADVPFVDVLNTMLDPTLSAVVSEYEEWGNPQIKEHFDYILSYAPYENVMRQNYPHILALAGFYDTRVNYWEAAKWVAKIREYKSNDNLVLLWTNMAAGHGGSSGRYDYLQEVALIYSFVFKILPDK